MVLSIFAFGEIFFDLRRHPVDFFDERELALDEDISARRIDGLQLVDDPISFLFIPPDNEGFWAVDIFCELFDGCETNS